MDLGFKKSENMSRNQPIKKYNKEKKIEYIKFTHDT